MSGPSTIAVVIAILWLLGKFCLYVYRITLHPLAAFPGPKVAGATNLYELYWDFCNGPTNTFYHQRVRLHDIHGPIVRINPNEVHINDADWFDTLYAGPGSIRDKDPRSARIAGSPLSIFGTVDHHLHRKRRAAINKYMSKPVVQRNESVQLDFFEQLCSIIRDQASRGEPIELRTWLLAYATDVVSCYSLGHAMGLLKDRREAEAWGKVIEALAMMTFFFRHFPWILDVGLRVPLSFWKLVSSTMSRAMALQWESRKRAQVVMNDFDQPVESKAAAGGRRPTVFHEILASDLPADEKSLDRLSDEGFVLIPAGSETTARSLSTAAFYLLSTDGVLPRLKSELDAAISDPTQLPPVKDLEQLPYLTAVVRESLRIGMIFSTRFPIISPAKPLQYGDWIIPPGTRISMTYSRLMMDESVYPDPWKFDPERFLPENPDFERNMRHLVTFGRGNRACYGQTLAMSEMYLVIAGLFRRFNFELYDTNFDRDIKAMRDCFIWGASHESTGLKVRVRAECH